MNIFLSKKMRNFIILAQTNNISKAAEKIHMTASPFGKSIAMLEAQIGYELFTRKDNRLSLNEAGQALYQKLLPVYQQTLSIDNEITGASACSNSVIVGIDNTYPTMVYDQLSSLCDRGEGIAARPVEVNEDSIIGNIFNRQLDFIVSPQKVSLRVRELENLVISKLPPLRIGFLVSRRYDKEPPLELLKTLPWLQMCFQNQASVESMLNVWTHRSGIHPTLIYRPYNFMSRIHAVEHGRFLAVVPHFAWHLVNPAKFKYFDAPHEMRFMKEYLYSLKDHPHTQKVLQHIIKDRSGDTD